ncbi:aminomethyl transferase family protein [Sphaerobacter sp.]|uniref:aminomethyl transferase family protein n=1 Tax=Sphaerobacter sp. TaxID=2099654 RepID=UPI001DA3BCB3|nr:aminomethyl transferase family protein [Sphaerobacter sp.]MBX5446771.1 aminomethyl transferase family protein [Sphaerobacter sp.]
MTEQARTSLQQLIDSVPNIVDHLYNQKMTLLGTFPDLPPEFTNWRDEQQSWRHSVALFDQSYHMTNLYLSGPDIIPLLERVGVNTVKNFTPGRAKQLVACSPEGHVIGDGILFYLADGRVKLVSRPGINNWLHYHAETGGFDVTVENDVWSVADPTRPRTAYRYELQGPNAPALLEELNGGPLPAVKYFRIGEMTIAGRRVYFLRHGMAGTPGAELFGPWEDGPAVKAAIVETGQKHGLRQVGSKAYITSGIEGVGWIPSPVPAVYTSPELRAYREWLPATTEEATGSLGGSFYSPHIEDYYFTPWDLGYGHLIKFDHDFIGREALEARANDKHRVKVTLVWNGEDVTRAIGTMFQEPYGERAKFIDWPIPRYALWQYDAVCNDRGDVIGVSTTCGYISNATAILSLAVVDPEYSQPGTQVTLLWGEPRGGSEKPTVERHTQTEIRATVAPVPYADLARDYLGAERGY